MCEVMPTINEGDSVSSQRGSQNGTDAESNFEQLMVNMLDERDKLLESLRETQETLIQSQTKLQDVLHERDVLQRQLNSALPQVNTFFLLDIKDITYNIYNAGKHTYLTQVHMKLLNNLLCLR